MARPMHAIKTAEIARSMDSKQGIIDAVGDLSGVEVFFDLVLLGSYIRPDKVGSILLPDQTVAEDQYQGVCGLILKMGPDAFVSDDRFIYTSKAEVGDWVIYNLGDARSLIINGAPCKYVPAGSIRMKVKHPSLYF